jgi:hypothetical protein
MDEFFYGTLPQDTQDFTQVLKGVRRSIGDVARGVSYYPYDLIGAPVDIINMALTPVGLGSQQPVLGSDYLRNIGKSLGLAQDPTGSIPETVSRIGAGFINPAAGARAVGQIPQAITRGANVSADKLVQMITQNPRATAMGVIDETSMPFMQAMAPKTPAVPGLMEPVKSDIGFYSQLEAATIPLQNKGTGDQYLAQIQKSAGVKPEEIQWTGLDEFLKGKKSVTKAEIQDYLNANRVDVREVRLGGFSGKGIQDPEIADDVALIRSAGFEPSNLEDPNMFGFLGKNGDILGSDDLSLLAQDKLLDSKVAQAADRVERYLLDQARQTQFSSYTLPGGENYREILLTLPARERVVETQVPAGKRPKVFEDTATGRFELLDSYGETAAVFNTRAEAERAADEIAAPFVKSETVRDPEFYSTHFDQPNILAHMRVNDRVVDGKKTLFIEEIQSDWHQAGRKKGYGPQTETTHEAYYTTPDGQRVSLGFGKTQEEAAAAVDPGWQGIVDVKFDTQTKKVGEGVPDAPFKTSWHELTLKRAIQEASEKGYDQIAFTTGKTQAERYDLSKQVDSINVPMVNQDGTRSVRIDPTGGTSIKLMVDENGVVTGYGSGSRQFTGKPLDEVIGKEMAEKVMKSEAGANFSGGDLAIGGEGMKGFYDNILPKSLDKLAKKFDAKVGKTFIEGERTRDASGIPSMYPEKIEVWSMDITPKMRESVTTKGQPLFAVPAIGAGLLGAGMVQDEQMY